MNVSVDFVWPLWAWVLIVYGAGFFGFGTYFCYRLGKKNEILEEEMVVGFLLWPIVMAYFVLSFPFKLARFFGERARRSKAQEEQNGGPLGDI